MCLSSLALPCLDPFFRQALFAEGQGEVVINELHVNPKDALERSEFVEIFNNSDEAADLSEWELKGAIKFRFPDELTLPAFGYVVVAEDPAVIEGAFGVTALGPFSGRLSNDGETVKLVNADDALMDSVSYQMGFPWPTWAAGKGASMELIDPNIDNSQGSAWRSSGFLEETTLLESMRRHRQDIDDLTRPTPGRRNSVAQSEFNLLVDSVSHSPIAPRSLDPVTFKVVLPESSAVEVVTLLLQIVRPGEYQPAYLPRPLEDLLADPEAPLPINPEFANPEQWLLLPMNELLEPEIDLTGSRVFIANVGPFSNRTLVRYRVDLNGTELNEGTRVTLPYSDDPSLNFALFVYDGVPAYQPTIRTVLEGGIQARHSMEVMNSLPVYHLLTREPDLLYSHGYEKSDQIHPTEIEARRVFNWEGTLVYREQVYDHVRYRLRQNNDRYNADWGGKRSFRFRFHRADRFRPRDDRGQAYEVPWRSLNLSKMMDGKRNQTFGLPEAMNSWLWDLVDIPAPRTHYVQMRVIDQAEEAPDGPDGQYQGDFWGVFLAFEDFDSPFVKAHDLPDGNLYKLKSRVPDGNQVKRHQGMGSVSDDLDFQNIRMNLNPDRDAAWLSRYVDYNRWNHYHAVNEAVRHFDYLPRDSHLKNRAWFFAPVENDLIGRLWVLPWDSDTSWGPNWGTGLDYPKLAIFGGEGKPKFKMEYRNVIREFSDLILSLIHI